MFEQSAFPPSFSNAAPQADQTVTTVLPKESRTIGNGSFFPKKNACEKFHDEAISCLFHRDSGCRFGEGVFLQLVTLSDATD
jgi:hypothetical protein